MRMCLVKLSCLYASILATVVLGLHLLGIFTVKEVASFKMFTNYKPCGIRVTTSKSFFAWREIMEDNFCVFLLHTNSPGDNGQQLHPKSIFKDNVITPTCRVVKDVFHLLHQVITEFTLRHLSPFSSQACEWWAQGQREAKYNHGVEWVLLHHMTGFGRKVSEDSKVIFWKWYGELWAFHLYCLMLM